MCVHSARENELLKQKNHHREARHESTISVPMTTTATLRDRPICGLTVMLLSVINPILYGRTLSDASMLYFADVFFIFFYARLSWPNG